MSAHYILRLDDACETMDGSRWHVIEEMLDAYAIKPIVAVIPENRDSALLYSEPNPGFWDAVRSWQAKGWTIAMHGYQHALRPSSAKQVLPFHDRTEFAGLPYLEQASKLRSAWEKFAANRVQPSVWIAPAHSFDWLTLEALRKETPIRIISDGIARRQYFERGFYWIPQQLWRFERRSGGLWTVCLHPNTMTSRDFDALRRDLSCGYAEHIVGLGEIKLCCRGKSMLDQIEVVRFWWRHFLSRVISKAVTLIRE